MTEENKETERFTTQDRHADELFGKGHFGSTSSINSPSTYQRCSLTCGAHPPDVLLSRQDLNPRLKPPAHTHTHTLCPRSTHSRDFQTKQLQDRMEKFGARPPLFVPAGSSQQRLLRRSTTYLAKIAVALQQAPNKMLTFSQVGETQQESFFKGKGCSKHDFSTCLLIPVFCFPVDREAETTSL